MRIELLIHGQPASKANTRKLAHVNKKGGGKRVLFIKSEAARQFEQDARLQIPMRCRVRLEGELSVTLLIFYANERSDLDESVVLDVLQDQYAGKGKSRTLVQPGVYRNDRQVRHRVVHHAIDARNPRVEIVIEPRTQAPLTILTGGGMVAGQKTLG